jgi:hypothetical protein
VARGDKGHRADAAQFFVAAELCRRELVAAVTLGNCPNTDILVSNAGGTRFAHVQVKTFVPGIRTCSVGMKAERDFGPAFFWVLAGIPLPGTDRQFEYFVVPAAEMASVVTSSHRLWLSTPGARGQARSAENTIRAVFLPPRCEPSGWSLEPFRERWDLIQSLVSP